MSLFEEEHMECPKCHGEVPFILHRSINVGLDPQDKEKVLDLSIFRYRCPHCGKTDLVCYPLLYHDPNEGIWIQVHWKEEDFGQPMEKALRELIKIMGQKNYRRREVFGYRELVEKILVFDAGLDDFAIALIKTLHRIQQPEVQSFFAGKDDEGLHFVQIRDETMLDEGICLAEDAYEVAVKLTGQWKKPHDFYENLRVDETYFYDDIINAVRQEEP